LIVATGCQVVHKVGGWQRRSTAQPVAIIEELSKKGFPLEIILGCSNAFTVSKCRGSGFQSWGSVADITMGNFSTNSTN
jgi:hypothetical protein